MFVNKTVLDACGVAVPGPDYTWDQFLADCQTILDNGYTPIACSLVEVPHYWFEFAVMNNGSIDDQLAVPTLDADGKLVDDAVSAKWIAALDDIKDLYERGFFPKNTLTAGDAETVALFGEDEAAFLIDGSWKVGYFTENHGDNLDGYAVSYVPAKGERKATEAIGGISMGYYITEKAWSDPEKRDAAVQFVEYMTTDDMVNKFAGGAPTALKSGLPEAADTDSLHAAAVTMFNGKTGMASAVQDALNQTARGVLFASVKDVVTGTLAPEEAIETALATPLADS